MRLLAIDTASEACSVGVVSGDAPPVVRSEIIGRGHAEILMRLIDEAMAASGLTAENLDRIAVTVGPGSFTGLRIGIAAARGLALVADKPAIGIGTLAVHAEAARNVVGAKPVMAVIDAGRGELYGALYAADGSERAPPQAASAQVFASLLPKDAVIAGSGADLLVAALPMDVRADIAHRDRSPDVAALCRLALAASPQSSPPRPLYLRPPDAKPQDAARVALR
jgi:tRNA threonylcarbamoyladenosine biosynthesis protein TsaB